MFKDLRNTYIKNMDPNEAKDLYFNKLNLVPQFEEIDVEDSLARISYEAVYGKVSSPNFNAAAMDGILVRADRTFEARDSNPTILEKGKDFIYINTGNIIEEAYDAVIMIEDVIELEDGNVKILKAAHPWQHVRIVGEDIVATEMIIPSRHKIRPIDIGAIISGGNSKIKVYKKCKVGILPTGSEIVEDVSQMEKGKIIDSNSRMFEGLIKEQGHIANRYKPVKDDYNLLRDRITKAVEENDVLLIGAGSSAGNKDYTKAIVEELGEIVIHGVAIKPGKPTILGVIDNKPVVGMPGYPVSSYLAFSIFVDPLLRRFLGLEEEDHSFVKAISSKKISSSLKHQELVRISLGFVKDKLIATPLYSGAGVSMSLVKADGIGSIPQRVEGIEAGGQIKVKLMKNLEDIKKTLVSIGSHDKAIDIIGDMMKLSSAHVGSMGGILSMMRQEAHLAPIHLLDMETGQYNISYIKKYFPNKKMALIKGLKRHQGFIVEKGNPKNIRDFKDLLNKDVRYVNRQRGAGTRILLDYYLKEEGINSEEIQGYDRELATHMAVAAAVKSGLATTGLGVYSAAKALDLDFIEITSEDYDFLLYEEMLEDRKIKDFISILKSDEFQNRVQDLGGYGFDSIGEIILI